MSNGETILTVAGVWKSYTSVVLGGVDFDLRRGETHALVGENGAGKSTLVKIISGLVKPDAGEMTLHGQAYAPSSKSDAERRGIRLVMQELNLIGNLSVAENIFLDQMPRRFGFINYRRLNDDTRQAMARVGLMQIDPAQPLNSLGVGHRQLVEIAAGLSRRSDVLILDEPTAALTDAETELLFGQIKKLTDRGGSVIYISHRIEEIRHIADRITVLRDGKVIATRRAGEVTIDRIIQLMVGRDLGQAIPRKQKRLGEVALGVRNLRSGDRVRDVSFEARRGEILGFAGLVGSGRTETMRAIFGADRAKSGMIFLYGESAPARIRSPRDARRRGIAFLTEDRKEQGLLLPLSIRANITLTRLQGLALGGGWIRSGEESAMAERMSKKVAVRCASIEQPVSELSGGNQQKVVIAKWLYCDSEILIFDEPTRGIDIGAKFEIYQLLAELADQGKAIIMVSSDLKELMAISDRIAVMSAGVVAATFTRDQWSQDKIMAAALSGRTKS